MRKSLESTTLLIRKESGQCFFLSKLVCFRRKSFGFCKTVGLVFGKIFPRAAHKHRLQMLTHFQECIKAAKAAKLEVLQINIFTALLSGLKGIVEDKVSFGGTEVISAGVSLIGPALTSTNPQLRCAAGECLGRIAQVNNYFVEIIFGFVC